MTTATPEDPEGDAPAFDAPAFDAPAFDALAFEVLGPLVVRRGGEPIDIGTPKARGVLAILLTRPNRPVPVHMLVDALWGGAPPRTAVKNIQVYIHQLRRVLGSPGRIVWQSLGYRLVVRQGELDAERFEEQAGSAGGAGGAGNAGNAGKVRAGNPEGALALWRGDDAYADILDVPLVRAEARRLAETRVAVLQERIDADLRHGRHARLPAELIELTGRYPLREGLWARLMTALYRCGRRAEALRAYESARRILAEETGLDPGPELRDLHRAILAA